MFAKNKFIYLLLIFLILLAIVGLWTTQIPQFINQNKDFTITVLNGFWTGFFALLFLGISSLVQKITKREGQHYNSLVNLGTQLNEMIGVIKDNIYVMSGFKSVIVLGNIHWGNLKPIFIDKTHYENLYDIDLINEVFSFFYQVRKINDDLENLQKGYNDLKNAYIQKQITVEHYVENAKLVAVHMEVIEVFLEELVEQLQELLARVRIQIRKDKPITSSMLEKLIYTSGKDITIKELKEEKLQLQEELDISSKSSRKEIARIVKKKSAKKNE
jgi:hypothetical protein